MQWALKGIQKKGKKLKKKKLDVTSKTEKIVLVVYFLLGNSPSYEFYMPTFRNTLFHLRRRIEQTECFETLAYKIQYEFYMPTFRNTLFHLRRRIEQTECFETSAYKIQTPGNYPEESIQHSEQGECLKSGRQSYLTLWKKCLNSKEIIMGKN